MSETLTKQKAADAVRLYSAAKALLEGTDSFDGEKGFDGKLENIIGVSLAGLTALRDKLNETGQLSPEEHRTVRDSWGVLISMVQGTVNLMDRMPH
jgi:hypothetical protein